tara:strand:+ start:2249 stop:3577 length:1329 start_codon:yes stop_codon:yes gene_type:complete
MNNIDILHEYNDKLIQEYNLSIENINELNETICNIIDYFICLNPLYISKYNFDDELICYITNILKEQFIFLNFNEDTYYDLINYNYYYFGDLSNQCPCRCNGNTTNLNNSFVNNEKDIKFKINNLRNKPQPDQRTNEWYIYRHNLITASSVHKVFGTESQINDLINEKTSDLNLEYHNNLNINDARHWGNKYEDLSIMFYELFFDTKVEDFGCLPHDKYNFIGASPDGINVKENNTRYGRMLEIKNVVSRVITGTPKEDYWIQMQQQLEVCDLNECDFLETKFIEYENYDEFENDNECNYGVKMEHINKDDMNSLINTKGMAILHIKNNKCFYDFMPLNINNNENMELWKENIMKQYENDNSCMWVKDIYWKLEVISCVLVLRNKLWFSQALIKIENVWKQIEEYKKAGKQFIKEKKKTNRKKKKQQNDNDECLFVIDTSDC